MSDKKSEKTARMRTQHRRVEKTSEGGLREPCFQCDLDIGHVCFNGIPRAKWGVES